MGWTSTGDPYANVGDSALGFDSEEAAKSFAQRHGWDYVVKSSHFFFCLHSFFLALLILKTYILTPWQVKEPKTPLLKVSILFLFT